MLFQILTVALLVLCAALLCVVLIVLLRKKETDPTLPLFESLERARREQAEDTRASRAELASNLRIGTENLAGLLTQGLGASQNAQEKRLSELSEGLASRHDVLRQTLTGMIAESDKRFASFATQNEQKLDGIRASVESRLRSIQEDNASQLEKMRATVDEKLQKTLEERIGQSFRLVEERLEQVYKGLGEMQTLASGVGDLKKVLSNVKTRGILGEYQLGAILEQMLSPDQYDKNVATKPGSANVVEFAVKLPGTGSGTVYLPIDAKFPGDVYTQLVEAYEHGTQDEINAAGATLVSRLKQFARDIRDKYISPPDTTDFAVMFLPFEGLYAEAVRRDLVEVLQREYKVNIAGPTTMSALLNSLQMGFQTLAIQKRSAEVWKVLSAVKTEFSKFGGVLAATQQRLTQAHDELDKLVGVRTRQITRKLDSVTALSDAESGEVLNLSSPDVGEDAE